LQRPDEAYAAYREALRYRPDDLRVLCRAGRVALARSQAAQAMEHLGRAAQLAAAGLGSVDFECRLARAVTHGELDEWRIAAAELAPLTAERPRNLPARLASLRAQLERNQIDEATLALNFIESLAPERADLLALKAWLLFRKRDNEAAEEAWLRGYSLDASEPLLWEVVERFGSHFEIPLPPLPERSRADPAASRVGGG